jgi:hypothetical protein
MSSPIISMRVSSKTKSYPRGIKRAPALLKFPLDRQRRASKRMSKGSALWIPQVIDSYSKYSFLYCSA